MTTIAIGSVVRFTAEKMGEFRRTKHLRNGVQDQLDGKPLIVTSISSCGDFYRVNGHDNGFCASWYELVMDKPLTPHVHADVIRAFADGHKIQVYVKGKWWDCSTPSFMEQFEYRVKPFEDTEAKKQEERWAIVQELHNLDVELKQLSKQTEVLEIGQRQIAEKISKARERLTELNNS